MNITTRSRKVLAMAVQNKHIVAYENNVALTKQRIEKLRKENIKRKMLDEKLQKEMNELLKGTWLWHRKSYNYEEIGKIGNLKISEAKKGWEIIITANSN